MLATTRAGSGTIRLPFPDYAAMTTLDFSLIAEEVLAKSRAAIKERRADIESLENIGKAEKAGFYRHVLKHALPAHKALETVVMLFREHGDGLQLRHKTDQKWAFLLPDATDEGMYRYQLYDKQGFFSHRTFKDRETALVEVAKDSFLIEDNGSLDRLAATPTWARGMEMNAVIQASNARIISWEEGNRLADEINARYTHLGNGEYVFAEESLDEEESEGMSMR